MVYISGCVRLTYVLQSVTRPSSTIVSSSHGQRYWNLRALALPRTCYTYALELITARPDSGYATKQSNKKCTHETGTVCTTSLNARASGHARTLLYLHTLQNSIQFFQIPDSYCGHISRKKIIYPPGRTQLAPIKLTQVVQSALQADSSERYPKTHQHAKKTNQSFPRHVRRANVTRTLQTLSMNTVGELGGNSHNTCFAPDTTVSKASTTRLKAIPATHLLRNCQSVATNTSQLESSNGIRLAGATTVADDPTPAYPTPHPRELY